MTCQFCGHESLGTPTNCPRCGAPLARDAAVAQPLDDRTVLRSKVAPTPAPSALPDVPAWAADAAAPVPLIPDSAPTDWVAPPAPSPALSPAPAPQQWPVQAVAAVAPPSLPPAPVMNQRNVVVVANRKSVGVALLLTFFFGPLGMFYSTVAGALVMLVVSVVGVLLTGGLSAFVTAPICMVWGALAAKAANDKVVRQVGGW